MTNRYRAVRATAGALLLVAALTACSASEPEASDGGAATTTAPTVGQQPAPETSPETQQPGERPDRGSPSPVQLPPRPDGVPTAKKVVEAFRAAGLPVANPRDSSADCGPDGLGLGCSEMMTTGSVTVYVYPDSTSAEEIATTWGDAAHQTGVVVLRYVEGTTTANRQKYEKVLAGLV